MSKRKSIWDQLSRVLKTRKPTKQPSGRYLHQMTGVGKKKTKDVQERIPRSEELMTKAETLYRLEPLIFSNINRLTKLISSPRIFFSGENADDMEKFMADLKLKAMLPSLVKDEFIYGYACAQIITKDGKITELIQMDPKKLDYQREGDDIARKADGTIKGYVFTQEDGTEENLDPEEVLLLNFYTIGDECLGLSPVEAAFKPAWIKLNIEEAVGEAIYQQGFPVRIVTLGSQELEKTGFKITPEHLKEAKEIFKETDTATPYILPWWIKFELVESKPSISEITDFMQLLSTEINAAFEMPKYFGVSSKEAVTQAEMESVDFERTVTSFQETLKNQLEDQLFRPYRIKMEIKGNPTLEFAPSSKAEQLLKARMTSVYLKNGAIKHGPALEEWARKSLGIPVETKDGDSNEHTDSE